MGKGSKRRQNENLEAYRNSELWDNIEKKKREASERQNQEESINIIDDSV